MRDLLARKQADRPLDVQLAALRTVYDQIPAGQRPTFLARLDEVCRAWTDWTPPVPANLPPGHPIAWDNLVPYERDQGGYWLYGTDPFGADKRWVPVKRPSEVTSWRP